MAQEYVNNGKARMQTLIIHKGLDSSTYQFLNGFQAYPQITATELSMMSEADYRARLNAFVAYVYSLNSGLEADCPNITDGAEVYNTSWCPLTPIAPKYNWSPL